MTADNRKSPPFTAERMPTSPTGTASAFLRWRRSTVSTTCYHAGNDTVRAAAGPANLRPGRVRDSQEVLEGVLNHRLEGFLRVVDLLATEASNLAGLQPVLLRV